MVENNPQMTLPLSMTRTGNLRAGSLRTKEAIKEALKRAIERSGLSREELADELSRLVGEPVSIHTINNWLAEGKADRRFPLEYAAAVTLITGDTGQINAAVSPGGGTFLAPDEIPFYELGKITAEERGQRRRKQAVLEQIDRK